jgi:putative phage-type endonuclease
VSLTAAQLEARRSGCGGADAAAALGVSKIKTMRQLYGEKRGELEEAPGDEEVRWWGEALEPIVRQKYAERTGYEVRRPTQTLWSDKHPFMCAHLDGYVDTPRRGYEGKTAFLSTGWGEEGTDEIPVDYVIQVQHYMVITALPVFDVCSLIHRRFAYYEVPEDRELQEMIVEGEADFMRRVREGDPPPIDYTHRSALELLRRLYPGTNGKRMAANQLAIAKREAMEQMAEAEKNAKAEKDAAKAWLLDFMGEAALLAFPDGKAFRRQTTKRAAYAVDATEYVDARMVKDKSHFLTKHTTEPAGT